MPGLKGTQIIYTSPFLPVPDVKHSYHYNYKNESDKTMRIYILQIWMGMDIGGRGDFWFTVTRSSDGTVFGLTNWDRYAEPTNIHNIIYNYTPNYIDLAPGDSLTLECGLRLWFWSLSNFAMYLHLYKVRGDISVTIWYEEI